MYDLENISLRFEIVMESQASHFGIYFTFCCFVTQKKIFLYTGFVFSPLRRKQLGDTLKAAVINRLCLPKNLKLRRKIVKDVKNLCHTKFKWDGNIKEQRRKNNITYSGILDKFENYDDDGIGTLEHEDVF